MFSLEQSVFYREIFCCPILFSLWRIRRSWLKNVIKKCGHIEVQREIYKRLGKIMYSIWTKEDPMDAMEELFQDFIDQTAFIQYFKAFWVPKIGKGISMPSTFRAFLCMC